MILYRERIITSGEINSIDSIIIYETRACRWLVSVECDRSSGGSSSSVSSSGGSGGVPSTIYTQIFELLCRSKNGEIIQYGILGDEIDFVIETEVAYGRVRLMITNNENYDITVRYQRGAI